VPSTYETEDATIRGDGGQDARAGTISPTTNMTVTSTAASVRWNTRTRSSIMKVAPAISAISR
jgi:hypothetical protein